MKNNFTLILFIFVTLNGYSQSGNWVWLTGSNTPNGLGNYGIKGISDINNEPPSRYQSAFWTDLQGDFWVFGGSTVGGTGLNDLWKYSPTSNEWTWISGEPLGGNVAGNFGIQGVPSSLNYPPAIGFGANCWTAPNGDLWMYGGIELSAFSAETDVVWRYNIASNQWTWISGTPGSLTLENYGPKGVEGASFTPGTRQECKSSFVYNNKLWLFGGSNKTGTKNDIWSFDLSTFQWAWQGGGQGSNTMGNYGTKGVSNPSNEPPSRFSYTKWNDNDNFYIFAGGEFTAFTEGLNDVWAFNKNNKEWTWISGTNITDHLGTNPSTCTPDINDIPKSRIESQSASTLSNCAKAFWLFGGLNSASTSSYNDLWIFNSNSLEWTKLNGNTTSNGIPVPSNYGIKGIPNNSNIPPGRGGTALFTESNGNLFVFGGLGITNSSTDYYSDVWKFIPDTNCFHSGLIGSIKLTPPEKTTICPGDTLLMGMPTNIVVSISPLVGATYNAQLNSILFYPNSTTTYTIIAHSNTPNDPCFLGDTLVLNISSSTMPKADFVINPEIASLNNPFFTLTNTSSNATHYEWYDANGQLISTNKDEIRKENAEGIYCYKLVAFDDCGNKDSTIKCGQVVKECELAIPNSFTPNGDGINDLFHPIFIQNCEPAKFKMKIFDRWGELLFSTNDIKMGWDGNFKKRFCEIGIYFFLIETISKSGKKNSYKGDINLLR